MACSWRGRPFRNLEQGQTKLFQLAHACHMSVTAAHCAPHAGEDVGHYGGSYKVSYGLYKKYGEMRLLDTPICGASLPSLPTAAALARPCCAGENWGCLYEWVDMVTSPLL